jgi:hypothetical protein
MGPIEMWNRYPRLCRAIYLTTSGEISEWRASCLLVAGPDAEFRYGNGDKTTAWDLVNHAFRARGIMRHILRWRNTGTGPRRCSRVR